MKNQQEHASFNLKESQYEKFNFLKSQFGEKSRRWDFISEILQDRIKIEEQYTKGIEDILQRLEDYVFEGVFATFASTLKTIDEKRMKLGRKIVLSLKANVIGAGTLVMEGAKNEIRGFSGQKKELTKDLQSRLEDLGKLKSEYTSQTKDCNLAGIEYECLKLQRDAPKDKKSQCYIKYQKLADTLKDTEAKYLNAIGEYNNFVDRMETCIADFNTKIVDVEAKRLKFIHEAFFKVWNESRDDLLDYQKSVNTTIHQALTRIDIDSEVQSLLKGFNPLKGFPPKIEKIRLCTFIQEGLIGVNAGMDLYEENIMAEFRKFYSEIIQSESQSQTKKLDLDGITIKDNDDLTFLAYFLHDSWKGKSMTKEDLTRFKQCMENQMSSKAFIGAIQQYRIFGKFVLNEEGYNNLAILLVCILKQLMDLKDAQSVTKLLILSFTFWKEVKVDNNIERKYLQSEIAWHPVWKDLDFWITAIFLSIHEELSKQNSLNLKESETQKESVEREQNTVFGQLLNFGHNMVAFMIKTDDAKLVIGQFCKLFSFRDIQIQKVMEFGAKKSEKVDFIMDYFAPKTTVKEPAKTHENDDVMDNVKTFLSTIKGNVKVECSSKAMQKAKNAYESKKRLKGDLEFILDVHEGDGLDDSTEISEMPGDN